MRKVVGIVLLALAFIIFGVGEDFTWYGFMPGVTAYADALPVCKAVAVSTSSTAVLAAGDLVSPGRSQINITNSGPNVEFCQFGTSNTCTTANGFLLLIGETASFGTQMTVNGNKASGPPQTDLCCIAFNGGGNTTANTNVCEW